MENSTLKLFGMDDDKGFAAKVSEALRTIGEQDPNEIQALLTVYKLKSGGMRITVLGSAEDVCSALLVLVDTFQQGVDQAIEFEKGEVKGAIQ